MIPRGPIEGLQPPDLPDPEVVSRGVAAELSRLKADMQRIDAGMTGFKGELEGEARQWFDEASRHLDQAVEAVLRAEIAHRTARQREIQRVEATHGEEEGQ